MREVGTEKARLLSIFDRNLDLGYNSAVLATKRLQDKEFEYEVTGSMTSRRHFSNMHCVKPNVQSRTVEQDAEFERLLDSTEAAALLRIHPKTLRKKARRGTIPGVQVGRLWRFRASVLNDWLEKIAS